MKKLLSICAAAFAFASAFTAQAEPVFYKVGPFDQLQVRGNVNVVYRCNPDSTGFATYNDDFCKNEPFELSVNNGKLQIKVLHELADPKNMPTIYLYSDFLKSVENEGDSTVNVDLYAGVPVFSAKLIGNGHINVNNLRATKVNVSLPTGAGQIVVSGKCDEASITMIGTGTIMADRLEAGKVSCKVVGTGTIGCWAEDKLDVRGLGTTKVFYRGNPEVKKVGLAKISALPEEKEKTEDETD